MSCEYCYTVTCKKCGEDYCEDHYKEHFELKDCVEEDEV